MRRIIPESLWIGDDRHEELLDEWFSTDVVYDDEDDELIARMVKELKDEPHILEFLGIF